MRSYLPFPSGTTLDFRNNTASLAISPDGKQIVFSMVRDRKHSLWVRSLDSFESKRLAGTEGGGNPFWSPDGRFIAFFSNDALKKVDLAGSPPVTICKSGDGRDGSWNEDGVIVFSPDALSPVHSVSATGGTSQPVTELDQSRGETTHRWATFLPDGKHFLFMAGSHGQSTMSETNAVYIGSLESSERTLLLQARSNVSYGSGHILYVRDNVLLAQPFDPVRRTLAGDPVPIAEQVAYDREYFRGVFSVSQNGVLVFHGGGAGQGNQSLVLYDRDGNELRALGEARKLAAYGLVAFSPDGSRAAMEVSSDDSQFNDIWIFDLERGTRSRFTFEEGWDYLPVWSPDGRRIAWSHSDPATGGWHVYVKDVDGSTPPQHRYGQGREVAWATAFSPDGRSIAVSQTTEGEGGITMISDAGSDPPTALLDHPAYPERNPSFSPDGKWVSWASWETGQPELYVASYPELRNRRQLSSAGVGYPAIAFWGAGEIIYLAPDGTFMSVSTRDAGTHLELGEPKQLFKLEGLTAAGVSPDGQRFAVVVPSETARGQFSDDGLMLVVNWTADLQKKTQ